MLGDSLGNSPGASTAPHYRPTTVAFQEPLRRRVATAIGTWDQVRNALPVALSQLLPIRGELNMFARSL